MSGPIAIGGPLLQYLTSALASRSISRRTPAKRSSGASIEALDKGYEKRVEEIGAGRKPAPYDYVESVPDEKYNPWIAPVDPKMANQTLLMGGQGVDPITGKQKVFINPNTDAAYLAHELGHLASRQTDLGGLTRKARDFMHDPKNEKLAQALGLAAFGLGGTAALVNPGDDDLATSIAMTTAPMVPTLLDEALASKNAMGIMKNAGMPATWGQKGRLAGGWLSYALPAIVGGGTANFLGNLFDENE